MGYTDLQSCLKDLDKTNQLVRIETEVDPRLEAGMIQRRVTQAGGPALLFMRVKNSPFPMVANLFGTLERTRYLFRDRLKAVATLIDMKVDPKEVLKNPARALQLPRASFHLLPKKVRSGPILKHHTTIAQLPQLVSWPQDGGAYITLPQVYSEDPTRPGWRYSNLGMYRVQLSGNDYVPNKEVGFHYQTHRGIGVHHTKALEKGEPLKVNVFVGGAPAMTLAAVMPLPEDLPELAFAGALGGRRIPLIPQKNGLPLYAEADFCITGTIDPTQTKPEGPFGDHLGYYSLQHDFPVMKVDHVFHRPNAIWPFTTVGRPPQEDTHLGAFIHEITGPVIPAVLPGVHAVHAVDATGVHPLLLAIGSERYTPYAKPKFAQELLTQAHAILGQGQLSLTKYLFMCDHADNPHLNIHDIPAYLTHMLERVDWSRDLHFQTKSTMDTLDYSGTALNQGSKVVITAVGPKQRTLKSQVPTDIPWPAGLQDPRVALPGILILQAKEPDLVSFCNFLSNQTSLHDFPLIVVVDDSEFTTRTLNNFLWVTFTRSNPATDIYGVESLIQDKHWGCRGPLVIDARIKPHHAPALEEDPEIEKRILQLAAPGGPLHGII